MIQPEQIVEKIRDIPPLPDVAVKIWRLSNSPDSSARDMVDVMKFDPGITARVLRLCNSAFFGLPRKVTSLQHATVYLGMNEIVNIVYMSCVGNYYGNPHPAYGMEKGDLWRHSVAVALTSQDIAQEIKYPETQAVFTAGLLHDLGKLLIHEYVNQRLTEIQDAVENQNLRYYDAEREVLGMDHCQVGELVANVWNLPATLRSAIRYHHAPQDAEAEPQIAAIVHIANVFCRISGLGTPLSREDQYQFCDLALQTVGLDADEILERQEHYFELYHNASDLLQVVPD